ncbi:SLC13 family permease [Prauserella endophytica]|nr:SLC13 family permease [Prauserella endophytica]
MLTWLDMEHLIGLVILALVFLAGTIRPISMGALALGAAFLVGLTLYGVDADGIAGGFPASMLVVLVGVTYLFAIATHNGTIGWLVDAAVRLVNGRIAIIPWIMFLVPCALTAIGSATPAAVAVIVPIALSFARQYRISEAMMSVLVIQGATAGGFSPIGIYGIIVNGLVQAAGLQVSSLALFGGTFAACLLVAVAAFLWLGGLSIVRKGTTGTDAAAGGPAGGAPPAGGRPAPTATLTVPAPVKTAAPAKPKGTVRLVLTLAGILTLVLATLVADLDVGFTAITVAVVLSLIYPADGKAAAGDIAWGTVLLICGIVTYIALLQKMGAIDWLGAKIANVNAPLLAAFLICLIGAVVSAFASTTAFLGAVIPIATPFLVAGQVSTTGLVIAAAIATSVVDCSPYSTMGALSVANAGEAAKEEVFRSLMRWGMGLVVLAPVVAWSVFVVVPRMW